MNGSLDSSLNTSGTLNASTSSGISSMNLANSGAVSEFGEGLTSTAPQDRTGRRPFLKVVVLYASDSRVLRYAKEVQTQFLDAGVDVYLQIDLDNTSFSGASGNSGSSLNSSLGISSTGAKDNEIKTENLAEIITSSTNADFLIVIGDRNMKNQSCQVKKRGKLVEMDVYDMVRAIWNEWAPYQVDFEDLDPKLPTSALIERLSVTQLYIILQRFPPQTNYEDALKRAREAGDEIKTFGKTNPNANKTKKQGAFPSLMTSSIISGSTVIFDEKQSAKFQTAQKNLIRFHKQTVATRAHLLELPESKNEESFVINQDQFGHHVGPDYRPQQALTGQISTALRIRLLDLIVLTVSTVEQLGAELATLGAPLWTGYISQVNGDVQSSSASLETTTASHAITHASIPASIARGAEIIPEIDPRLSLPTPAPNEWSCDICTSFNDNHLKECDACGNPRIPNANADDGAWETAGEKKARKKREAEAAALSTTTNTHTQNTAPGPRVISVGGAGITSTPQILTKATAAVPATTSTANATAASTQPHPTFATAAAVAVNPAPTPASLSTHVTTPSTPNSAPPKKKLLDPIPGLAAKQAAKTTTPKDKTNIAPGTPPQPSAPAVPYTSPGSTYSSIVSGNAAAVASAQDSASLPVTGALQANNGPAADANVDPKSALNEIFGSSAQQANSTASASTITQGTAVLPSFASSPAVLPTSNAHPAYVPSTANGSIGAPNSATGAPNNAPVNVASLNNRPVNSSPYFFLNNSNELPFPMMVPNPGPQAPLETPMTDLFERWKQQQQSNGASNTTNAGSPWGTVAGPSKANAPTNNSGGGLRTPTKNASQANAPHTPTFTTPFKGSNTTPASRYGPPPSPMHLPSSMNAHHHHQQHHHQSHSHHAHAQAPVANPHLSQVVVPIMAPHYEEFAQAEPKIGVKNPCWYCGEESTVECNLCPKVGLETFFCSGQHQAYIWKFHVRTCHPVSPTLAASFEKDGYHPSTQQSYGYDAILPAVNHQRRESNYNSMPRYPSPGGRHKYT